MIKEIIKDKFLLSQKAKVATQDDFPIIQDLLDTIKAHADKCVGMAANMIGYNKSIIVIKYDNDYLVMLNPKIIKTSKTYYIIEEGCLSHQGTQKTKRFEQIKVAYQDINFNHKIKSFSGFSAQIIQHEIDHCNGIII